MPSSGPHCFSKLNPQGCWPGPQWKQRTGPRPPRARSSQAKGHVAKTHSSASQHPGLRPWQREQLLRGSILSPDGCPAMTSPGRLRTDRLQSATGKTDAWAAGGADQVGLGNQGRRQPGGTGARGRPFHPKGHQEWGSCLSLPDQDPVGSTRNTGQDGPLSVTGTENECRCAHLEAGGRGVNAFRSPSASVPERSATPGTTAGSSQPEALCSTGRGQMFTSSALLTLSRVQLTGGEQYSCGEDVARTSQG